jgi:hypothetical protein
LQTQDDDDKTRRPRLPGASRFDKVTTALLVLGVVALLALMVLLGVLTL